MAGHSKWANIKHRKSAVDAKRGKIFHRLVREITVAAKLGGSDLDANSRLRIAVSKARSANMPADTIDRAIKKGAGELEGITYEEIRYEIYAPGGVGLIVDAMTDKKSRTTPEIKAIITKHGGNLADLGAVTRLFEEKGDVVIERDAIAEDELLELALEAGAEDVVAEPEYYQIFTTPGAFSAVTEALGSRSIPTQLAEVRFNPIEGTDVAVDDPDQAAKLLKFIDLLEEHDDVQAVYHNASIPDEVLEAAGSA